MNTGYWSEKRAKSQYAASYCWSYIAIVFDITWRYVRQTKFLIQGFNDRWRYVAFCLCFSLVCLCFCEASGNLGKNGQSKKDRRKKWKTNNMKSNLFTTTNIFMRIFFYAYWIEFLNQFYRNHLIRQTANAFYSYECSALGGLRPTPPFTPSASIPRSKGLTPWTHFDFRSMSEGDFLFFYHFFHRQFFPDTANRAHSLTSFGFVSKFWL